jgi:hypothetical protein
MADDVDSFGVRQVDGAFAIKGLGKPRHDRQKKGRHQQGSFKQPRDYIHTIVKAAEASNEKLVKRNLPYRFTVYSEGDQVFIDLIVLDPGGKVISEKKKNISHQDFERLIEDVSQIEGLFFDRTA